MPKSLRVVPLHRKKHANSSNGSREHATLNSKSASAAKSEPPTIIGFDTEDDSKGTPLLFGFVHGTGSWQTKERAAALEYLHRLGHAHKKEKRKIEVWATNLEYDLLNLFGPERISEVFLRWGRNFLVGARWQGIEFRDTVRHIPVGVEQLGELIGMKKLETALFKNRAKKPTEAQLVRRCLRDAGITFRTAKELHAIYHGLGERPRLTLASTARSLWQEQYFKAEVYRPLDEIWEAAGAAYYGGRTEPFRIGDFGPVTVIDVASMFPWAMTAGAFPIPWGAFRRVARVDELQSTGVYRVRASSNMELPLLPHRTEQGLIYPNGDFEGWYVGEELQYFKRLGGTLRVLEGFEFFDECRPFDEYVADLFQKKQAARGPLRMIFKLLLNALYGKFGQKGEKVVSMPLERFQKLDRAPLDFRVWNGLAVYRIDGVPPPWGNNVWPAIVTARARVRLHQEMKKVLDRGGKLFYCDTDSVMFDLKGARYPSSVSKPGRFELRGRFKRILIVGKKEYALEDFDGKIELHAKGVPMIARQSYLETGKAEFQRPTRLLESTRTGNAPNVWTTRTKQRRVSFASRARKADGSLAPLLVTAGGSQRGKNKGSRRKAG